MFSDFTYKWTCKRKYKQIKKYIEKMHKLGVDCPEILMSDFFGYGETAWSVFASVMKMFVEEDGNFGFMIKDLTFDKLITFYI